MNRLRTRKLNVEHLEDRSMMAGNVTVVFKLADTSFNGISGNNLYVTGDAVENRISVESLNAFTTQVQGFNDSTGVATTVNGLTTHQDFGTKTIPINNIIIRMGNGNDLVRVTNVTVKNNLSVELGDGNDELVLGRDKSTGSEGDGRFLSHPTGPLNVTQNLYVNATTTGAITGANGDDLLYASDAHITGNATILMGNGNDTVRMKRPTGSAVNVEVKGNASIQTATGIDTVDITGFYAGLNLTIDDVTGKSVTALNTVKITLDSVNVNTIAKTLNNGDLNIITDDYDNANTPINVSNSTAYRTININTGKGTNSAKGSTTVNLTNTSAVYSLILNFSKGNDKLYINGGTIKYVTVNGSDGNDLFDIRSLKGTSGNVDGGLGTDTFTFVTNTIVLNKLGNP